MSFQLFSTFHTLQHFRPAAGQAATKFGEKSILKCQATAYKRNKHVRSAYYIKHINNWMEAWRHQSPVTSVRTNNNMCRPIGTRFVVTLIKRATTATTTIEGRKPLIIGLTVSTAPETAHNIIITKANSTQVDNAGGESTEGLKSAKPAFTGAYLCKNALALHAWKCSLEIYTHTWCYIRGCGWIWWWWICEGFKMQKDSLKNISIQIHINH